MTLVEPVECAQCGAILDLPVGRTPIVSFVGRSGKPNERVLVVDGEVLHRCKPVPTADPTSARPDRAAFG